MDNEDELIFIAEELKSYGRWLSDYDNAIEALRMMEEHIIWLNCAT